MDQIYDQHTRAGQAAAAAFEQGLAGPDEEELAAELRRGARSFVAIAEDWLASPSFDEGLLEAYRGAQRGGGTHDRNIDPAVLLETILGVYAELPEELVLPEPDEDFLQTALAQVVPDWKGAGLADLEELTTATQVVFIQMAAAADKMVELAATDPGQLAALFQAPNRTH